jgi:hypothetical protein
MKKENEKIWQNIAKLEEAIKELDDKVVVYSGIDEKLLAVEKTSENNISEQEIKSRKRYDELLISLNLMQ